ncbi:hypothetical protein M426DRAFT_145041 [Hypoxylon sp. CI-4A]|nr:hypothetical protein M426DRAFT_145041 [Hypoxylon sp. CI-4A]
MEGSAGMYRKCRKLESKKGKERRSLVVPFLTFVPDCLCIPKTPYILLILIILFPFLYT